MKLTALTLENFQGIAKATFNFGGRDAKIFGDNGTGKTTVYNAFTYLLFGRASTDTKNFTPKTKSADGELHNLDHSVKAEIDIGGEVVILKRTFKEVWSKKRGNPTAEMTGHVTEFSINGVPTSMKEYDKYLSKIIGDSETAKLLTMPFYFAETISWDKRRGILLDICGNVSDSDVIEQNADLAALPSIIGSHSVGEHKKISKASMTDINRQLNALPARIDEAKRAVPDAVDEKDLADRLSKTRVNLTRAQSERADILKGGENAELKHQLFRAQNDLSAAEWEYKTELDKQHVERSIALQGLRDNVSTASSELSRAKRAAEETAEIVVSIERKRAEIIKAHKDRQQKYNILSIDVFDEDEELCNKCGQKMPEDKIAELNENFNTRKSEALEKLKSEMDKLIKTGEQTASKAMLSTAKYQAEQAREELERAQEAWEQADKLARDGEIEHAVLNNIPFVQTDEYSTLKKAVDELQAAMQSGMVDTTAIDEKIKTLQDEEQSIVADQAAAQNRVKQLARIAELETEEEKLGEAYQKAEKAVYLCEQFTRAKADMLTDKINSKFKTLSFSLFKKNITNDGIEDCCEILIPSAAGSNVNFGSANNAARINAGLEIIDVLSEHYGVSLPLFVDNAESIVRLSDINTQVIQLVVSEQDKELRLETCHC